MAGNLQYTFYVYIYAFCFYVGFFVSLFYFYSSISSSERTNDRTNGCWLILHGGFLSAHIGNVFTCVPLAVWAICVRAAAFMFMCLFLFATLLPIVCVCVWCNWMGFYGLCKRILSNLILHIVLSV